MVVCRKKCIYMFCLELNLTSGATFVPRIDLKISWRQLCVAIIFSPAKYSFSLITQTRETPCRNADSRAVATRQESCGMIDVGLLNMHIHVFRCNSIDYMTINKSRSYNYLAIVREACTTFNLSLGWLFEGTKLFQSLVIALRKRGRQRMYIGLNSLRE